MIHSSREHHPGVGYPSCSRALARVHRPVNQADPNRLYFDLGLPPWASMKDIRSALRAGFRAFHPDGTDPDPRCYARLLEISEVLTHPARKRHYDSLPQDRMLADSRCADDAEVEWVRVAGPKSTLGNHWDWFSVNLYESDVNVAQRWYAHLVAVAPLVSYRRTIRVLLHDDKPRWEPRAGIMMIPRSWTPSTANAFALFSVLVGRS